MVHVKPSANANASHSNDSGDRDFSCSSRSAGTASRAGNRDGSMLSSPHVCICGPLPVFCRLLIATTMREFVRVVKSEAWHSS